MTNEQTERAETMPESIISLCNRIIESYGEGIGLPLAAVFQAEWIAARAPLLAEIERLTHERDALKDFAQSMMDLPATAQYAHIHAIKLGAALALGESYTIPKDDADMECGLSVCSSGILDTLRAENAVLMEGLADVRKEVIKGLHGDVGKRHHSILRRTDDTLQRADALSKLAGGA